MDRRNSPEVLVVTGGIACGKSSFCDEWQALYSGSSLFCADEAVHEVYRDPDVVGRLVDVLGCPVADDGSVDRAGLRELVMGDPEKRRVLEGIVHPMVRAAALKAYRQAADDGSRWFLADVPLYFEGEGRFVVDAGILEQAPKAVVVGVGTATQMRRMKERNGFDNETSRAILAAQMPVAEKLKLASFVVWNEGTLDALRSQVVLLHKRLANAPVDDHSEAGD
ncbi:dephospho-CoA kinase [Sulfuriroseicoccus oceanibius]|uniref:Dephospho-CoA kinase n=1 Tax=Sulfuriroseicoccus oceanibius TaxID=2707525 RepID=A0A6B3L7K3_9BACT|nr:dephospho-CoA kinase [Sulfuriroseicoccus oceanibius]QQL44513.1 dephospho-CoA kinase [Sulfuriroseicoccus oceanibius]